MCLGEKKETTMAKRHMQAARRSKRRTLRLAPPSTDADKFDPQRWAAGLDVSLDDVLAAVRDSKGVFFYPLSRFDWQPIKDFRGQCDLFVYCDWRVRDKDFDNVREQVASLLGFPWPHAPMIPLDEVEQITGRVDVPWLLGHDDTNYTERWGRFLDRPPTATDKHRGTRLLYVAGDPIVLYRKLFTEQGKAPKFMCLRKPADVSAAAWVAFAGAGGPLASVVEENPNKPVHYVRPQWPIGAVDTNVPESAWRPLLAPRKVCFYPACGFDWNPIQRFTDRCRTFIYCDWDSYYTPDRLERALHQLPAGLELENMEPVDDELLEEITETLVPAHLQPPAQPPAEEWGHRIILRSGGRRVKLFFLLTEGVKTYWSLFKSLSITPEILCIIKQDRNWTDFALWANPLGRVVHSQWPKSPKYLAVGPEQHDWPLWNVEAARFENWTTQFGDYTVLLWRRRVMRLWTPCSVVRLITR